MHFVRSEPYSNLFRHLPEYKRLSTLNSNRIASAKTFVGKIDGTSNVKQHNVALEGTDELSVLEACHGGLRNACRFDWEGVGFNFGNTGLKADPGVSFVLKYVSATHGAMGGAPLAVEDFIPAPKYRSMIALAEAKAMRQIETGANCFLKMVGEPT